MSSRALLISADAHTACVIGEALAEMGILAEECQDLSAAGQKLAAEPYQFIVVDSPDEKTGNLLLSQARSSKVNKSSLVINVVNVGSSVRNIFAMGANFVVYRPVTPDRARASLRAASPLARREKRQHRRASLRADADLSYANIESMPATLVDLSMEGLALQCGCELPRKSKIYFRFTLPGQTKCVQISGETVWQDPTGRAGIRFLDVPQAAHRVLKEWLNAQIAVQQSSVTLQVPAGQPGPLPNSPSDRRTESRHACQLGAAVYRTGSNIPHRCNLTDISVGGCYVEMPSPFSTGTKVEMVVRTPEIKFRSQGVVQVVHTGFGMGVAFGEHTAGQREQVQQLIQLVFKNREAEADPITRF
jgi:hypothetical protein